MIKFRARRRQKMAENIRDQLHKCVEISRFTKREFIPKCKIADLVTRESVSRATKMDSSFPFEDTSTVIAILVYLNEFKEETLKNLIKCGLTNDCLPVTLDQETASLISKATGKIITVNPELLSYAGCSSFCQNQWLFLAPELGGVKHSKYDDNAILPIIEKDPKMYKGSFGKVFKVKVHPAHLDLGDGGTPQRFVSTKNPSQQDNPYIALKELLADEADPKKFDRERQALEAIQKLQHPHLINYYGSFQMGDESEHRFFFLFPWASGGNLKSFWSDPVWGNETRSPQMMRWILSQIEGLVTALGALHGPRTPEEGSQNKNGRHGDLRPENIVVFRREDDADPRGNLQITDAGLARFHELITNKRPDGTSTQGGSIEYSPPEANEVDERRGRRYDMWSLGCILLEFIVWTLGGIKDVNALRDARKRMGLTKQHRTYPPFYLGKEQSSSYRDSYEIHPVIKKRIAEIKKDRRCPRGSFLRDLLELIQDGLLCIQEGDRWYSEVLIRKVGDIVE
ncbi:Protein kinase-like domain containing protein, partial [Rhypophila decipiens]